MKHTYLFFFCLLVGLGGLRAQDDQFPPDTLCAFLEPGALIANVFEDDGIVLGDEYYTVFEGESPCIRTDEAGNVIFSPRPDAEACCGPQQPFFLLLYRRGPDGQDFLVGVQQVDLTIKCPKPDCGLVDLDALPTGDPTTGGQDTLPPSCLAACENSTATYLFAETPGLVYDWQATNGSVDPTPGLPNQITVSWGSLGPADLTVDIYDASGNLVETLNFCVTLTPAPVADFTFDNVACLNQEVYFTNASIGAPATYDWNFGDGQTAQNVANPSHAYSAPGTYTVTLYATSDGGLNPDGSQACCCTDSISYDIEIDPLPGPGIFWVSTLCEGDVSKYWTDATGCDTVRWQVSANGVPQTPLTGDTIVVQWLSGPSGTLTLEVVNCDQAYCDAPVTAVVPIISSVGDISGPLEVCKNQTTNYQLPKWMTTTYNWSVNGGAVINGDGTGHAVSITWPDVPGEYEITVNYGSDFLAGLPGHMGNDCYGQATLTVTVLGDFVLTATPNPACTDGSTFFDGISDISGSDLYDWSVIGYPALDLAGQPDYTVNWGSLPGPGVYTIVAEVTDPENYCTGLKTISVVVKDAIDPTIVGPADYCVGDPVVFSVASPAPGYTYNWSIDPAEGNLTSPNGGPTVTAVFTSTTGASISVSGQDAQAPFCQSALVSHPLTTISLNGPATVLGPDGCTNSLAMYSLDVAQHPSATYAWSVFPAAAGSVVAGADAAVATVQWNELTGPGPFPVAVSVDVTVCGQTATFGAPFELNPPIEPVIVQQGDLCPGGSAQLFIDSLAFTTIDWDLGANAGAVWGPNAGIITVFEPGNYVVNTVDTNGCPGVARYRVEAVDGPDVIISISGQRSICVSNTPFPGNPVLTANTDPANTIEWICNGISQGPAATGNTSFTHVWNATPGTFGYVARVVDPNGCTEVSDPIFVEHQRCCGPPFVSDPLAVLHTFDLTQQTPNCDVVDLVATWSADSADFHGFSWNFLGAQILAVGGDDTVANDSMTVRLPGVGSFTLFHSISVWAFDYDTTFITDANGNLIIDEIIKVDSIRCGNTLSQKVNVPLFADFDKREECGTVAFTDQSEFLGGTAPPGTTYSWQFGDPLSSTSSATNPSFTYPANGSYQVTLTVSDGSCESTSTMTVVVEDLPDSDFTFAPGTVCYGESITFTGTGSNVISWEWDFDDGSFFVGNGPQHTFLPPGGSGTFDVQLITENSAGCMDTVVQTITVLPLPADDAIVASNGLIICEGETTTLSVNSVPGLTYLWSTGETTNSIVVDAADTYGVTVTTADGCVLEIEPVEVQLIPLPDAGWVGNPYICDDGFTTLTAVAGGGHTITWTNTFFGFSVNGPTYNAFFNPSTPVQQIVLTVVNDAYGCVAKDTIEIFQVISPDPVAQITAGDACEGTGTQISVVNFDPALVYTWSTGASGPSIFTYAAGTYTVIATDPVSGCSGIDRVLINPLPDLCIVPTGCYEPCIGDTIPGPLPPAGVTYTYDWIKDGVSVSNAPFLVVMMDGTYTLTVTNDDTGCEATSEDLILEVVDCDKSDCDDIVTRLRSTKLSEGGDCCWELYYDNLPDNVYLIQISSPDADLAYVSGSQDPAFNFAANVSASAIQLAAQTPLTTPVPTSMTANGAVTFCQDNFSSNPQTVIIDYLGQDGQTVICSDTLFTDCPAEPDCVYVTDDRLLCDDDGNLVLSFTVCNPADADFQIGFLQLLSVTPGPPTVPSINLPLSPVLLPGDCQTFTVALPPLPAGSTFAYNLIGHTDDPFTNPDALCCSDPGAVRKLPVPDCDPCDNVAVVDVSSDEDACCHKITLDNQAIGFNLNGIGVCLIDGDATLNVYSSATDPLIGNVTAGGDVMIAQADGSELPIGQFTLPTICLEDGTQPFQTLEIKWLSNGEVLCRDTITVFCQPPCGFLTEQAIDCKEGAYVWNGTITNTSSYTMAEAYIAFDPASGLGAYNQTIVFGSPLAPGASTSISFNIGSPAGPGDTVCFRVILHETGPDDLHLNCCEFDACVVLPDCQIEKCVCESDQALREEINVGIDTTRLAAPGFTFRFAPVYTVTGCDELRWEVRGLNPTTLFSPMGTDVNPTYTFALPGRYQVRLTVTRTDNNGEQCKASTSRNFVIGNSSLLGADLQSSVAGVLGEDISAFPNPTRGQINLRLSGSRVTASELRLQLTDLNGRLVKSFVREGLTPGSDEEFRLNLGTLPAGVYLLRGDTGWARKIVIRK